MTIIAIQRVTNQKKIPMQRIIFLVVTLIGLVQCKKEPTGFNITGTVSRIAEGTEILLYDTELGRNIQKSIVTEGKVSFFGNVEGFRQFYLHTGNFESYRSIWIENSNYTLNIKSNQLENATVSGSKLQEQGDLWDALFTPLYGQHEKLSAELKAVEKEDSLTFHRKETEITALKNKIRAEQLSFLGGHPDFDISAFYLFDVRNNFPKNEIEALYKSFSSSVQNNFWGKKLDLYLNQVRDLTIGDKLEDIRLPTINDELISLGSLQGNYVLVEFWESSCHSCSAENAVLAEVYHRFKSKGFEIYAICLDHEKATWQNTLKRDNVDWITVSDLQGLNGDMAIQYNISYMPTNYLISPDGFIVARDLRGKTLSAELERIFGSE